MFKPFSLWFSCLFKLLAGKTSSKYNPYCCGGLIISRFYLALQQRSKINEEGFPECSVRQIPLPRGGGESAETSQSPSSHCIVLMEAN